jgi:hypothetical protein
MGIAIAPTVSDVQTAAGAFLTAVLPSTTAIIAGLQNRSAEPVQGNYVVVTPIRYTRLETNIDSAEDCKFTGSFAGNILTVTAVEIGELTIGSTIFGPGVAANTNIVSQTSGPSGGAGNYTVSVPQTLASGTLSCGEQTVTMNAEVVLQLDFHSLAPDYSSGDNAQIVSTLLRDEFGVDFIAGVNPAIAPFYADDPKMMPFINDQSQIEWRWVLEARFQVVQTVSISQQYFDSADLNVVEVPAS